MLKIRRFFVVSALACVLSSPVWATNGVDTLVQKGASLAGEGKLDEALATLTNAVEQYPDSSLAYTRLGGVRVLRQEYSLGIEVFQKAIMLDQSNSSAFVGLAVAYLHLGQYTHAREALKEAEKLDPGKKTEIGKLLAWIDERTSTANVH